MKLFITSCCFFLFSWFSAYAQPVSEFLIDSSSGCIDDEVEFISLAYGGVVQWDWDFGDGTTSTDINPEHTYTDIGTFTITLVVTDGDGLTDSYSESYIVRAPKANFTLNPDTGCAVPHTVFFTDESDFPDTWLWEFGDGSTSTLQNPVHNYTAFGDYMASLTVSDTNFGCTNTFMIPIKVASSQTNFTANGSTFGGFGCGPLTVDFEDTSTVSGNDTIDSWLWDFGDGNSSSLQNPTHVYQDPGSFNVSLTTTLSITGCSNNETKPAFVFVIGPNPDFTTVDPTTGCDPLTVNFMDMTLFGAPITDWDWDFGDGNTSDLINPSNTYITEGLFDVTLTITDIDGCSRTETKVGYIDTRDTTPPTILCPGTQNENADAGCMFIMPDYSGFATASDNCGTVVITQIPAAGTVVGAGITAVTLTAFDGTNTTDCSFDIDIQDTSLPSVSCQNLTIQLNASGSATITAAQVDNGSTDNCGITSLTIDISTFDCSHIGNNNVTLTATDAGGNMASCTAIVTVEDSINPVATCQDITVQLDASGMASIIPSDVDGGSSDNCTITASFLDISSFSCADVGVNTVLLTVTDSLGNVDSCAATVTVQDMVTPSVSCQDITVQLDGSGSATIMAADIDNGSSDACGIASMTISQNMFNCSNLGANNVILIVTDVNGNTSSCGAVVTVVDDEQPVAICQNITIQLDATGNATITAASIDNGSSDNCSVASSMIDIDAFNCSNLGANNVTLTITDTSGNTANCIAIVTVEDIINPIAVCQNITVQLDASGMASIIPSDVDGGSSDNCMIIASSLDISTFSCVDVGANNVMLTIADSSGNTDSCSAIVTVQDMVTPTVLCVDITVSLDATSMATITPADIDGGSSDACGIASTTIDVDTFDCSNLGTNLVTLTVTDVNGNSSSCVATVTVIDTENPVAICQDITVQLDALGVATIIAADVDGGSSDNCAIASLNIDVDTFDCSNVGVNTINLTVTDNQGNIDSCSAIVTVQDNITPLAICQNITVELDAEGIVFITPSDIDGGSSDACGIANTSINIDMFDCSDIGTNNVILTVVDVNGNTSSCMAIVTVQESSILPIAICQNITVPLSVDGTVTILPQSIDAGSSGLGCFNNLTLDIDTFDCNDIGAPVQVTLTVTNGNGVTDSCTAFVNIVDTLSPTIECPEDQVVTSEGPYTVPDYFDLGIVTAIDNCENTFSVFQEPPAGTILEQGSYNVATEVIDPSGNTITCVFRLTVDDLLGVTTPATLTSVLIYPNPTKNEITLANPKGIALDQVSIYDISGRLVRAKPLQGIDAETRIDISELASATYIVIVSSETAQRVLNIVKQ